MTLCALLSIGAMSCGNNTSEESKTMTEAEALKVLDVKIHKDSKNAELYYNRAKVLLKMNRANDAINDMVKATSLEKDNSEYFMLLGDAYFANGDVDHSYKAFQDAINLDEDNTEAYLKLGEIAFYSRDYDRAMENLGKVTAEDKTNLTALFMKGFIYKETGDTNNAVYYFRRVCDLHPEYEPAFEELGTLYALHHDPMAVEYLSTAIKLEPNNTNAKYCLAMYYQEIEQVDQAEELYKQILDIDANNKDAWHNRGYIEMFYNENYDLAIEYLTKAVQCDNRFIEAHVNRGCAYELKGDKTNAEICFRSALEIEPGFKPAIDGLSRLEKK